MLFCVRTRSEQRLCQDFERRLQRFSGGFQFQVGPQNENLTLLRSL